MITTTYNPKVTIEMSLGEAIDLALALRALDHRSLILAYLNQSLQNALGERIRVDAPPDLMLNPE